MRTSQAYLILRFLTWPPAILVIACLAVLGMVVDGLGLDQPDHPPDYVCIGQVRFDLNDEEDLKKLRDDMVQWGATTLKAMQRPPCDGSGSAVPRSSTDKVFSHLR
jgi:hypothetical protein